MALKRVKIQKCHRHLAYEIRNVKGTKQSICTDTYLVVYLLTSIGQYEKIDLLFSVGRKLKLNNPCERCKADHQSSYASCATDAIPWGMVFFNLHSK